MKDKLSQEELLKEFDDMFRGCPLTKKGIQAHAQIKSILTPVPEDVLFNKKRRRAVLDWAERWKNNLPFKAYKDLLAILKIKESDK